MTDAVYMALMRVVKARTAPKVELLVDGHSGFLFLDKSGMPKVAMHLENYMRGLQARFEKAYGKLKKAAQSLDNSTKIYVLRYMRFASKSCGFEGRPACDAQAVLRDRL